MSDNDLIRRGDVLKAVYDALAYSNRLPLPFVQTRIRALPAVQPDLTDPTVAGLMADNARLLAERDALIRDRDRWAEEAQASTSPTVAALTADNARLRAELTKQASEPAWGPKPRTAPKPVKRAGVKAARKQRHKADGRG